MIDNIIMNQLLPDLARAFLQKSMEGTEPSRVEIDAKEGAFAYTIE